MTSGQQVDLFADSDEPGTPMLPPDVAAWIGGIALLPLAERVRAVNDIREAIHEVSPFAAEPVDFVRWLLVSEVAANDYNPNSVAPPEMELLRLSIDADGYTQPIVAWEHGRDDGTSHEVVDGFHRHRVATECESVRDRVLGYVPIASIKDARDDRNDRIASTIRHNRARGKHQVEAMSDIVVELKRRNWSDKRIGKELGMDPDEVLRLCQITGLAEMFAGDEYGEAWEPAEGEEVTQGEDMALEWVNSPVPDDMPPGWDDRTEHSSVLYGTSPKVRGLVQKSRVEEKWHWYCYRQPMVSGELGTRDLAKDAVESAWGSHE